MEQMMTKRVTKIAANPLLVKKDDAMKLLRVAAYCRVSTDEDEQINSYEAQIAYYTEKISKNPQWIYVDIYADEGKSGTNTKHRKDFMRLMEDCEKGKIDLILTKSISRFARNTVDSLSWVRKLRAINVGVYFEEQAIDSLKVENEMLIGLFSVIAQAESENISGNVRWGIRQSMKIGHFCSNFSCFGYEKGDDGVPKIVIDEASVVKDIFDRFLDGYSLEQITDYLNAEGHSTNRGKKWSRQSVYCLLKNEKYVGDLLLQKSFIVDPISKKRKINRGELPKYYVSDNHPAIIERFKFNRVQAELARRGNTHKKATKTKTDMGRYSAKHALSEILICGECGSHCRRRAKTLSDGSKKYYWRCNNRTENGSKTCSSPGVEESKLQAAILRCLNNMFTYREEMFQILRSNLIYAMTENDAAADVISLNNQIEDINSQIDNAMNMMLSTGGDIERYEQEISQCNQTLKVLREQLEIAKIKVESDVDKMSMVDDIMSKFESIESGFSEYDDVTIRRLVECIRLMNDGSISVTLKGGIASNETI